MSRQEKADVVTVRIPRELAARIDVAADGVPRERWVRRALEGLLVPEAARSVERRGDALVDLDASAVPVDIPFEPSPRNSKPLPSTAVPPSSAKRASEMKPGGCKEHPRAKAVESRGRFWCGEDGCSKPAGWS